MRYISGNDGPGQVRSGNSSYTNYSAVLAAKASHPGSDHWDVLSQVPWIGYDDAFGKHFYSYENQLSIQAKIDTIKNGGFGGIGVWELFRGYVPEANPPDELLQYVRQAVGHIAVHQDAVRFPESEKKGNN